MIGHVWGLNVKGNGEGGMASWVGYAMDETGKTGRENRFGDWNYGFSFEC